MADESMVRTLAAQAEAIWPQESLLFDRYRLPARPSLLDTGCGTGEISARLAHRYPDAEVVAHFDDMLETLRDPEGYGAWLVPVLSGVKP